MMASRLEDERAIETLIRRYVHLVDAGRWEDVASLFVEGGELVRPSAPDSPIAGREAILAAFRARPARLARHLVCNTVIGFDGPDVANATSYSVLVSAVPQRGISLSVGAFDDVLVREGGIWLFRSRRGSTAIDEAIVQHLLALT
ncbi:hypothetical protein HNR59_004006 [Aquamicrobium lusatiense]|uniref:SnoaL-like domain-containing protein n=2 Tax=Aquamicrobium lusatiense TaxID=89772 RepID=A0A7W9VXQ4_9HYPH|nr:hypothetical protein [Aquamicrobium lusatiense]